MSVDYDFEDACLDRFTIGRVLRLNCRITRALWMYGEL